MVDDAAEAVADGNGFCWTGLIQEFLHPSTRRHCQNKLQSTALPFLLLMTAVGSRFGDGSFTASRMLYSMWEAKADLRRIRRSRLVDTRSA
jgi:hypothetical protein